MKNLFKQNILTISVSFLIIIAFTICISLADSRFDNSRLEHLKSAIVKTAVSCYAIEGFYPPDLQYLKDNYGLIIDDDSFTVYYETYGSNILPDITVLKKR